MDYNDLGDTSSTSGQGKCVCVGGGGGVAGLATAGYKLNLQPKHYSTVCIIFVKLFFVYEISMVPCYVRHTKSHIL